MDSGHLSIEQLEAVHEKVIPLFRYIQALLRRIEKLNFPYDDPLRCRVACLCDALHSLHIELHYMECDKSKGRLGPRTDEQVSAYLVHAVVRRDEAIGKLSDMKLIVAETPLEAAAKLARQGSLNTCGMFTNYVRVVLTEEDGKPEKVVVIELTADAILPRSAKPTVK